jgi:hypothetical protein
MREKLNAFVCLFVADQRNIGSSYSKVKETSVSVGLKGQR